MLAMSMASGELDFVKNAKGPDYYDDNTIILALDPISDTYKWFKVITSLNGNAVRVDNVNNVYFTPDGSKLLVYIEFDSKHVWSYLHPDTGNEITTNRIRNKRTWTLMLTRDAVTMTNTGGKIFAVFKNYDEKAASLGVVKFDGANFIIGV